MKAVLTTLALALLLWAAVERGTNVAKSERQSLAKQYQSCVRKYGSFTASDELPRCLRGAAR